MPKRGSQKLSPRRIKKSDIIKRHLTISTPPKAGTLRDFFEAIAIAPFSDTNYLDGQVEIVEFLRRNCAGYSCQE